MEREIVSKNRIQTVALGKRLGGSLQGGEVLGLVGEFGSGKTTFVKGIAQGLGIPETHPVNSPSFVLLRAYEAGRLPLYHFDMHRLSGAADLLRLEQEIGIEEYLFGKGVSVLEWADRLEGLLPERYLRVTFENTGGTERVISLRPVGSRYEGLIQTL